MEKKNSIIIRGARENNLKNIDLDLPKNKFIVFSGVSGSGKSTLAFDTIYQEGKRRYLESLSSYARQFLGNFEKPDVDKIEGLCPSIAIEQKTISQNPRSTVGTVTEIYDYLRLLFAKIGKPFCPIHGIEINSSSITKIVDYTKNLDIGNRLIILAPLVSDKKGTHNELLNSLAKKGFLRVRIDKEIMALDELKTLDKNKRHSIEIVIDRIIIKEDSRSRIFDSTELAIMEGEGKVIYLLESGEEKFFSTKSSCPICGFSFPNIEPRLFSFNAPLGCCNECNGLGVKNEVDLNLLIPDKNLSIMEGGIKYLSKKIIENENIEWIDFKVLLSRYNINPSIPISKLTDKEIDIILNGSKERISYQITTKSENVFKRNDFIEGIKSKIERLYEETDSEIKRSYYASFLKPVICSSCQGARLSKEVLSIKINNLNIFETTNMSLDKLYKWIINLKNVITLQEYEISKNIILEISNRLLFLLDVGLNYLSLARSSGTLSGGEAQRIRLATQIGSKLSGILYVLDEPSIGLHQKDNEKLIKSLREMVDLGNTLIVVEHDNDTIKAADFVVDIGPLAGSNGGEVIYNGDVENFYRCNESVTADYLYGRKKINIPLKRRQFNENNIIYFKNCYKNNLKNIDVKIPIGLFTVITGVSGSGKSSLLNETIFKGLYNKIYKKNTYTIDCEKIEGYDQIDKIINISQEPIGRSSRSNPATYIGVFDEIREIFALTNEAKLKGYNKSRFSFNLKGGRCEKCQGAGVNRISMNFLPDVYVMCDECSGKRYNEETLECKYKGKNIYDVLEMTVEEALYFFSNRKNIYNKLKTLYDVGLGYIKLGQAAPTLSGGEAQRVKLANELQKKDTGKTLYILDEPTTGLHPFDIEKLINVLMILVNSGNTVCAIEHNLDVIKVADYIIDIGKDGGDKGGEVIASGTPEELSKNKNSYTGNFLKKYCKFKD